MKNIKGVREYLTRTFNPSSPEVGSKMKTLKIDYGNVRKGFQILCATNKAIPTLVLNSCGFTWIRPDMIIDYFRENFFFVALFIESFMRNASDDRVSFISPRLFGSVPFRASPWQISSELCIPTKPLFISICRVCLRENKPGEEGGFEICLAIFFPRTCSQPQYIRIS